MKFFSFFNRPKDEERKMPNLALLKPYVNKITSTDNGVDGVFVLDPAQGLICNSTVTGGSGITVDVAKIERWATAHTVSTAGEQLDEIIGGQGLQSVDYIFTKRIIRLFYVTNKGNQRIVVGFVCGDPENTGGAFRSATMRGITEIIPMLD